MADFWGVPAMQLTNQCPYITLTFHIPVPIVSFINLPPKKISSHLQQVAEHFRL